MKKAFAILGLFLAFAVQSFAGVVFASKAAYKAAKFITYPTRHPVKDVHAAGKTIKFVAKSVYAVGKFGVDVVK